MYANLQHCERFTVMRACVFCTREMFHGKRDPYESKIMNTEIIQTHVRAASGKTNIGINYGKINAPAGGGV